MDPYFDSIFERMFINSYSGESVSFSDVEELCSQITNYEQQSNMKLFIYKSCISNPQRKGYRQYKCAIFWKKRRRNHHIEAQKPIP